MGIDQFMQSLAFLPQLVDSVIKMDELAKENFIDKLGLPEEERAAALHLIGCFQSGKTLDRSEQQAAQGLLEKALQMNGISLGDLFGSTFPGQQT